MIAFYYEEKKIHETNVVASLAPAVGTLVKIKEVDIPYDFKHFKVAKVVYIFNGGVDAEVYLDLPNVV
jgi:hypothetical protein